MWHDNETTEDLIGFERFAELVVTLTTDKKLLPVTIGLFGDWGSGKSSVLKMAEAKMKGLPRVIIYHYDGWAFDGYDDAKAALMTGVIQSLREDPTIGLKLKDKLSALLKRVNWFRAIRLLSKGIITLTAQDPTAAIASLTLTEGIDYAARGVDAFGKTVEKGDGAGTRIGLEEIQKQISAFRAEFEELVEKSGIDAFVVFIDDLDRCLPESIISTLEAIKLFLAVPKTAFVIAADERIVKYAISTRYAEKPGAESNITQEYLDKMVQIPFKIPRMDEIETETYMYLLFAEKELDEESFKQLNQKTCENRKDPETIRPVNYGIAKPYLGEAADKLEEGFSIVARIGPILAKELSGNPRLVKRFLNALNLRTIIASTESIKLDEGVLAKLMVLERFHSDRFEELYAWQANQHGIPDEMKILEKLSLENEAASGKSSKNNLKPWLEETAVVAWLKTEPGLSDVNLSPYFYLARETIGTPLGRMVKLTEEQQKLFTALCGRGAATRKAAAKELTNKTEAAISGVVDGLWDRFCANPGDTDCIQGLIEVAVLNEPTASKILSNVSSVPLNKVSTTVPSRFARIGQAHSQLKENVIKVLQEWANCAYSGLKKAAQTAVDLLQKE